MLVFGHLGFSKSSTWNFGKNPMERHNMLFIKGKKHKSRYDTGEIVNPAESPESLAKTIIQHHTNPGDTVLVACAGSGADAAAALKLGSG
jgi:DNA modification methylase